MKKIKIIIVLQARCGSRRFKNKSLYPINGIPISILCAKRLTYKSNLRIILATSKNKVDDNLVELAKHFKINYFRGSEKNVLNRLISASKRFDNETILIRATADNPLTDSDFVKKCIKIYLKHKLNYFFPKQDYFNIPHGLNIEIISLGLLRKLPKTNQNKQHVTFSIKKKFNPKLIKEKFLKKKIKNKNYTIDYVQDYIMVKKLMEKFNIYEKWNEILKNEK